MMLKEFYSVEQFEKEGDSYSAVILLNENHSIFEGHFPQNPVMPGVCMMQIVMDIVENTFEKQLFMQQVSNVKFMSLINPFDSNSIRLDFTVNELDSTFKVKSSITHKGVTAFKMNSSYLEK